MTMSIKPIELWSDFDGTAVATYKYNIWKKVTKLGLPLIDGYKDFLDGVKLEGVDVAGVVTRRPDILIRRYATQKSIAEHGLAEYFSQDNPVIYAGSETKKAQHMIDRSSEVKFGLIDDRPQRVGREILDILASEVERDNNSKRFIALGGVDGENSAEGFRELVDYAEELAKDSQDMSVKEFDYKASDKLTNAGYEIKIGRTTLDVVRLANYSTDSGRAFVSMTNERSKPRVARVIGGINKGLKGALGVFSIVMNGVTRRYDVGHDGEAITVSLEENDETDR